MSEYNKLKASLEIATEALRQIECMTANQVNILPFETINKKAITALRTIRDMEGTEKCAE